ncbi:MAG: alpha/beta hydrolase [Pseudohongiellaceae bacterium]|nr:alpha/beta hydrolase [Pseudohongiellaceae bacterium]
MNVSRFLHFLFSVTATFACMQAQAQLPQPLTDYEKAANIVYGKVGERELLLDTYIPTDANAQSPLLVWVHGGAWRSMDKERVPILSFLDHGYAVASIDFRLSGEAPFPAQVHDIKAAVRYLRANADAYDPNKIVLVGASSGGHLAAIAGVTNGNEALEGDIGDFLEVSSQVQAIVSYFGASNLTTILSQSTPHGLSVRIPSLDMFLGGQPEDMVEVAKLASPVFHVDANDPPLHLIHGDQDPKMPINQSHELHNAYKQAGVAVRFDVVHGGEHSGPAFWDEIRGNLVRDFLSENL